jgi:hypothetical protein
MLEKAKREFKRLANNLESDNIFNFFVTAYHVIDYIKALDSVPKKDIQKLYSNPDFKKCRFICLKSKHHVLNKGNMRDDEFITYRRPGAMLGEFVIGESVLDGKRAYFIVDKIEQIDVLDLGERVINLWETFFDDHNI